MATTTTKVSTPVKASTPVGNVVKGTVLTQGNTYTDTAGRSGVINYDAATGAKLATGGSTKAVASGGNQSTTTLSTGNAANKVDGIQANTTNLSNTGVTTDPNTGISTNANGTVYSPAKTVVSTVHNADGSQTVSYSDNTTKNIPSSTVPNATTQQGGYYGDTYIAPGGTLPKDSSGNYVSLTDLPPSSQKIVDTLNTEISRNDANTANLIASLKTQYEGLIADQKKANIAGNAGETNFLLQAGALQHTGSGQNVLDAKITAGISALADLSNKEAMAITQAQIAGDNQDFQLQEKINSTIEDIRKEKQNAIIKMADDLTTAKNKITDQITQIALDAKKNGADDATVAAIEASTDVNGAISVAGDSLHTMTGDFANYPQYKQDMQSKGLVPLSATDWLAQKQKDDAKQKFNDAYNAEAGKNAADVNSEKSDKVQQGLEKDFKNTLLKEFSSRSGTYGLNDAKVSQANKLAVLFDQAYDPKTGNYNLASSQYGELVTGLASLISNSPGGGSDADIANLKIDTAKGDWNKIYTFLTGSPSNASTQDVFKLLAQSVDREARQAEADRATDENKLIGLAPTDLDPARRDALIKAQSIAYKGIQGISDPKSQVLSYTTSHPDQAEKIAQAGEIPGMTPEKIWQFIQTLQPQ